MAQTAQRYWDPLRDGQCVARKKDLLDPFTEALTAVVSITVTSVDQLADPPHFSSGSPLLEPW